MTDAICTNLTTKAQQAQYKLFEFKKNLNNIELLTTICFEFHTMVNVNMI